MSINTATNSLRWGIPLNNAPRIRYSLQTSDLPLMKKVYFLSDAHLGLGIDSPQRERDLVAFLDSIAQDVDTLVLLGDIFDFWFTYKHVVPRGFSRFIGHLAQLSDMGVTIHYFIGNHDMWVFDYFQKEIGAIMHDEPAVLELGGHRMLLGHGDGLEGNDPHYNFLKRVFRCRFNQRLFALLHPWIGFSIADRWSVGSRKKHPISEQDYRGDAHEGIYQYALLRLQQEPFDYALFGHRHGCVLRPLHCDQPSRDAFYLNIGNWIERRDYAVLDATGLHAAQFQKTS